MTDEEARALLEEALDRIVATCARARAFQPTGQEIEDGSAMWGLAYEVRAQLWAFDNYAVKLSDPKRLRTTG